LKIGIKVDRASVVVAIAYFIIRVNAEFLHGE